MSDDEPDRTPWSAPDAEPEPRPPEPIGARRALSDRDVVRSEAVVRWAATAGYVGCVVALMVVLGAQIALWLGLLLGVVLTGIPMAGLWIRQAERVSDARIRAEHRATAGPFDPGPDPGPRRRSFGIGPGNDGEHGGTERGAARDYGPYAD